MASKIDQHIAFHQNALGLRAQRQQILASNIANADTPNYKARDIDFSAALKNALEGQKQGIELSLTSTRHIPGSGAGGGPELLYRRDFQASADGNTVNMDIERSQFAENSIYYEAGINFISRRLKGLMTAIQGQ